MNYELHHGDCLEILRDLPDGEIDSIICDPPYGTTDLEWDKAINWTALWPELWRACKPNAVIVMFSAQPFTTDLICSQREFFRYEIIWEKTMPTGFFDANRRPLRAHENILIFARTMRVSSYNPQKTFGHKPHHLTKHGHQTCRHYNSTTLRIPPDGHDDSRYPRSVLKYSNGNNGKSHPTQKPVDLMQWLVKSYTNEGETVLDFTMGSGSTGVAAIQTGRRFIGIEQSAEYCEIARKRLDEAGQQMAMAVGE